MGDVDLPVPSGLPGLRVLIADDHRLFREGVAALLRGQGMEVVGEAGDAPGIIRLALEHVPDVILMDIGMPGGGLHATREITRASPHLGVVIVTMFEDDDMVFQALRAGARGYVLKGADPLELLRAVQAAARGEAYFGPGIARRLITYFDEPRTPNVFPELTPREREVLSAIARGENNAAIARALDLSPKTVRNHISNIFSKLHFADRAEAIVRARGAGLG
ncbi:DNA-binding NarL/FixJ family response regulator [Deinococcus metalli]|uniref:DNA-binding NarL/FixJ family response regulator n=1 Tax=Deinococcus metalli TaxID=1141878 RepID=A0A7W8NRG2_9DEIO|nr:response regulator transcription factor [Deinococcus metalli]MBB5378936.1 DNA-binding NarL/FixJ family response regulator [Deinococcus metalli]GHF62866.1 DNA-binding response regulator [Deinococcus metalli]